VTVTVDLTTPTADAGTDFTKTCVTNPAGKEIGKAAVAGETYAWLPITGLSDATISNPVANPSSTTTYTLTVTNTASGCTASDEVIVTVDPLWKADCDGDGIDNENDEDPLDPCNAPVGSIPDISNPLWQAADCDGDGISNGIEGIQDTDGDGIPNYLDTDSDGDGISDFQELLNGTNPLVFDSVPVILMTKKTPMESFTHVGDKIDYLIEIKNEGLVNLTNLILKDPLTGLTETISTLKPGEIISFQTSYSIKQTDIDLGKLVNKAIMEVVYGGKTYTYSAIASIDYMKPKSIIEANTNNFDDKPINSLVSGAAVNVISNDLLNGKPVQSSDVLIELIDNGSISGLTIDDSGYLNIPLGTPAGNYEVTYRICEVADPSNCAQATVTLKVIEGVDLRVSKEVESYTWYEGDELTYLIRVENIGEANSTNVTITDNLPSGMRFVSYEVLAGTATVSQDRQLVTVVSPSLQPGSSIQIGLKVKILPLSDGLDQIIINSASVYSSEIELNPVDNSSSVSIKAKAFLVPNVITPNGDGFNDTFVINGLGKFISNELFIINKWGDHVFQRKNYQNDWSAIGLPGGTYYFILIASDEAGIRQEFKGWLQVIRD
jgi:uncharacterized repeat protein (TIGR01451 family)/gliding motility-associated-like protein